MNAAEERDYFQIGDPVRGSDSTARPGGIIRVPNLDQRGRRVDLHISVHHVAARHRYAGTVLDIQRVTLDNVR